MRAVLALIMAAVGVYIGVALIPGLGNIRPIKE